MTRHYVTTAAAAHLAQLRVLHASMRRHCGDFRLHVLAEGDEVTEWGIEQPDVGVTTVGQFLGRHPHLSPERLPGPRRRPCELAWTWRWRFAVDVLRAYGPLTVLDVDLMFWSSPEPVFDELGAAWFAVLPHAFAPAASGLPGVTLETHRRFGLFNAGWVYFADPAPAHEMAELCRQGPMYEDRRFPDGTTRWGEQGALEYLAEATGAHVIEHPGACPGPWNAHAQSLERGAGGGLDFGGRPLVAYHYQSYRHGVQLADAPYEISGRQAALLYAPYARELIEAGA
jgi:hypothetical protein